MCKDDVFHVNLDKNGNQYPSLTNDDKTINLEEQEVGSNRNSHGRNLVHSVPSQQTLLLQKRCNDEFQGFPRQDSGSDKPRSKSKYTLLNILYAIAMLHQ